MTRVAINGAGGRMGKTLVQAVHASADLTLGAAIEHPDSPALGADAGELAGVGALNVAVVAGVDAVLDQFDTLIDFTVTSATLALLEPCASAGKRLVIGTTGFDAAGLAAIHAASERIAMLMAPNMSVGVNVAFKLIDIAARALGDDYNTEVLELHHRYKIDAPSGTAVRIGEIIAQALGRNLQADAVYGREGITGARATSTIGFAALRGGDAVGDHTAFFVGEGERIEITHRVQSRANFAQGALRAVRFLADKPNGLFDMQDLLGLKQLG